MSCHENDMGHVTWRYRVDTKSFIALCLCLSCTMSCQSATQKQTEYTADTVRLLCTVSCHTMSLIQHVILCLLSNVLCQSATQKETEYTTQKETEYTADVRLSCIVSCHSMSLIHCVMSVCHIKTDWVHGRHINTVCIMHYVMSYERLTHSGWETYYDMTQGLRAILQKEGLRAILQKEGWSTQATQCVS